MISLMIVGTIDLCYIYKVDKIFSSAQTLKAGLRIYPVVPTGLAKIVFVLTS